MEVNTMVPILAMVPQIIYLDTFGSRPFTWSTEDTDIAPTYKSRVLADQRSIARFAVKVPGCSQ